MIGLWPSATPCSVCHHELESVHSPGVTSWERGFALALLHLILFLRLPFCGPQAGNRFYCAVLSVLKVACGAVWTNDIFLFASGVFVLLGLLSLMLVSYTGILQAPPVKCGLQGSRSHLLLPPLCAWVLLWHSHDGSLDPRQESRRGAAETLLPASHPFQPAAEPPSSTVYGMLKGRLLHRHCRKRGRREDRWSFGSGEFSP